MNYVVIFVFWLLIFLGLPGFSWNPELYGSELIVLVRGPTFEELRVADRFVVPVGDISVCYMLMCMFWVVSGLVLPLGWSP
jgi:hypothetical protein